MLIDPLAIFRAECAALIAAQVKAPAGYVFEVPPRADMGLLACNVAFQLPRLWKDHPLAIAQKIVGKLDRASFALVGDVRVAGPGFINFYADGDLYIRLVLDAITAGGPRYGQGDAAYRRMVEIWSWGDVGPFSSLDAARATALATTLAHLYRFHGDGVVERQAASDVFHDDAPLPDDLVQAIASSRAVRSQGQHGVLTVDTGMRGQTGGEETAIVLRDADGVWTEVGRGVVAYYLLGALPSARGSARPLSMEPDTTTDLVLTAPADRADRPRAVVAAVGALRVKGRFPRLHLLVPGPVVIGQDSASAEGSSKAQTAESVRQRLTAAWAATPTARPDAATALHDALIGVETTATATLDLQKMVDERGGATARRQAVQERLRVFISTGLPTYETRERHPDGRRALGLGQQAFALAAVLGRFPDTVERTVNTLAVPLTGVYGEDLVAETDHFLDVLAAWPDGESAIGIDVLRALARGAAQILDALEKLLSSLKREEA